MTKGEDMSTHTAGFYWHVHHDELIEWCWDYGARARYIRDAKPKDEQDLRLGLFQPVRGDLPAAVVAASQAYREASQAYDEASQAYREASQAYREAGRAYHRVIAEHSAEIEALHAAECPGCPWDGETIFPDCSKRSNGWKWTGTVQT